MIQLRSAILDFFSAVRHYRIWFELARIEVRQRYRRSVLGPWWISLSMLIFILAMGAVFSRVFHQGLAEYIPFFTAGFLAWSLISMSLNEATEIFRANESFIKQVRLPLNLYILKHLTRHFLYFCHNFFVYIIIMLYFHLNPGWTVLWAIPGFLLLFLNLYWLCLLVALLSTRYRDMAPLVASCIQIAFFVTPISWMPKLIGIHSWLLKLNPLVYFIGAIRNPLTGQAVSLHTWGYDIATAVVGCALTFLIFACVRSRVPFWVD
jgi:lipopolysaccharide transport system permease protein